MRAKRASADRSSGSAHGGQQLMDQSNVDRFASDRLCSAHSRSVIAGGDALTWDIDPSASSLAPDYSTARQAGGAPTTPPSASSIPPRRLPSPALAAPRRLPQHAL